MQLHLNNHALKVKRKLIEGYMKCSLFFRGAWLVKEKVSIRALARGNDEFFNGKDIGIFLAYVKSQQRERSKIL